MEYYKELTTRSTKIGRYAESFQGVRNLPGAFNVVDVPGDGGCFFYCLSLHYFGHASKALEIKAMIAKLAKENWDALEEPKAMYASVHAYLAELATPGYWGGSVECEIINVGTGAPVVVWETEDWISAVRARIWPRISEGESEINLAMNVNHFRYLEPKEGHQPKYDGQQSILMDEGPFADPELEEEDQTTPEDLFLPAYEKERLELLSRPQQLPGKEPRPPTRAMTKKLKELIESERTLPIRVGRLLSKLFPCNVKVCALEEGTYLLVPEHSSAKGSMTLRDFGWLWSRPKLPKGLRNRDLFVAISDELMAYSDSQFILSNFMGKTLLASHCGILPDELIRNIATCVSVVVLSTFLYKSPVAVKRRFMHDNLKYNNLPYQKAERFVSKMRPYYIYNSTTEACQKLCSLLFGAQYSKLSLSLSRLPAAAYLTLSCIDISTLTIEGFETLIAELAGLQESKDDIPTGEVSEILLVCERVEQIHALKTESASRDRFREWAESNRLDTPKKVWTSHNYVNKLQEFVLNQFFAARSIVKFISKRGKAHSGGSITSLLAYISNLVITKDKFRLTHEDVGTLEAVERRLSAILSREGKLPIPTICKSVETQMTALCEALPQACAQECSMLFTRVRNADSYPSAWNSALRLKGVAYEGLFAKRYHIRYIPEDQKPTLSMAIQTFYPSKFETFLERTQLHPEIREFKPDFLLGRTTFFPKDTVAAPVSTLQQMECGNSDPDAAEAYRRPARLFPLPEVPIDVPLSFERIQTDLKNRAAEQNGGFIESASTTKEDPEEPELMVIEVGFQTDAEGKVVTDLQKWKTAVKLLESLGIRSSVIACSDSSTNRLEDWFISQEQVKLIKSAVSNLFSKLQANSPQDVTDIMVGAISTQKIRAVLRAGITVKTPVTVKDIYSCWRSNKTLMLQRPTGATLPKPIETLMETALVRGSIVDHTTAEEIIAAVADRHDQIADWVERTKACCYETADISTSQELMLGWLVDDLSSCRCKDCLAQIKSTLKSVKSLSEQITYCAQQMQLESHPTCCHPSGVVIKSVDILSRRTPMLTEVQHFETEISDLQGKTTSLDRLVRLTLPGKTEKERRIKRSVESLIRISMKESGIPCIKLPTGQIVVNNELFRSKARKSQQTTEQTKERLERISSILSPNKLRGYSDHVSKVLGDCLSNIGGQKGSLCEIPSQWVKRVLQDLDADVDEPGLLTKLEETQRLRREFQINNDKLVPYSNEQLKEYLSQKATLLIGFDKVTPFRLDCILHKETYLEVFRRLNTTPYYSCIETIGSILKLLLRFEWYQHIVLYSKICETFLQCCTEFNRSGVKIRRVRHSNLNLAIALPSNKKENMRCVLYSGQDTLASSGKFIMSRRTAVLGAALPYIYAICLVQCLQHSRCVDAVDHQDEAIAEEIASRTAVLLESATGMLTMANEGNFEGAFHLMKELMSKTGNYLNRSSRDIFVSTVAGVALTFGVLLGPTIVLNSQPFNKQLQNMRFSMLMGLARIASPRELGKKLSSSSRRIESYVARLYLQVVSYCSGRNPSTNISEWKRSDLCPEVGIPSLTIYGSRVTGDRQLIFDIYLVHIYNKEMDNFDEGCIKVLQETLEKHASWELDVLSSVKSYSEGDEATKLKEFRSLRLLLGLPNIKLKADKDYDSESTEAQHPDSSSTRSGSVYSISKTRSYNSETRFKSMYGRLKSNVKPYELEEGFEVLRDPQADFMQVITDSSCSLKYKPKVDSILKDIKQIIKENPSHTYGSFDLVQCMAEFGRKKFPPEAINKAKRDPRNWQSVSGFTETTSSVSEPRSLISIKEALKVLMSNEVKKNIKMLRNRQKKLDGGAQPKPEQLNSLVDMLSTVETLTEKQKIDIKRGLTAPSKLLFYPWKEIVQKSVRDVLITNDANYIYCWLKSLASMIKRALKTVMPGLRYSKEQKPKNPKLDLLYTKEEIEELTKLMDTFKKLVNPQPSDELNIPNKQCLQKMWVLMMQQVNSCKDIVATSLASVLHCMSDFASMMKEFRELQANKVDYEGLSFIREEIHIKQLEQSFIKEHDSSIMHFVNLVFFTSLCCPWSIHYKSFELLLSKYSEPFDHTIAEDEVITILRDLGPCDLIFDHWQDLLGEAELVRPDRESFKDLYKYCCSMFSSNSEPLSAVISIKEEPVSGSVEESALTSVRAVLAKYGLDRSDLDFKWTLNLIANSNFEVAKRMTGRTTGERLPRSVRSKVIYEMIKLVGGTGMAILQQHAFSYILNSGHRFFAVLAPKAQLGGHRDLLVQEIMTKLVHAASETFSRSLLATTRDDGLTNMELKETILQNAFEQLQLSEANHGRESAEGTIVGFTKTFCISGDRTKWGPIHCTSFFSGMMQQLLQDSPDWNNFFRLVMLKNLYRQVEVPSGATRKILNSFKLRHESKVDLDTLSEDELRHELSESLDIWEGNPMMQFLVQVYLSKGKMALECYNHMGQGIHHATSSVMTSCMAEVAEVVIRAYFRRHMPELVVNVQHAGSSDDYAKTVTVSGLLPRELFKLYERSFWSHVCRLQNAMVGVARACQMKDSAKTLIGDVMCEFYSEFMLFHRVTPAVIKFILTGLINSSVTSPQSMVQACQVSSQQALYNSVPLLTNIMFTVFRQQMFYNHTELFQRKYGPLVHGLPSSFGRLYIPIYSGLTSSTIAIEDAEALSSDLESLVMLANQLRATQDPDYSHLGLPDPDRSGSSSDAMTQVSSTSLGGTGSVSSGSTSSFKFSEKSQLSATEREYLRVCTLQSLSDVEDVIINAVQSMYENHEDFIGFPCLDKLKNSPLCMDCIALKELHERPIAMFKAVRSIIAAIVVGYYRSFSSEGTEKTLKANLNRDENKIIEDPMIQLVPEKLRRELHRLGLSKLELAELASSSSQLLPLCEQVARRVITMNCQTEDYEAEVDRLKQTLSSRNIIHGLAGGIKELSLPLYTIFLKSYFFIDNVFINHADRWNSRHSRNYRDSSGRQLDGRVVTKYMIWLDAILSCTLSRNSRPALTPTSLFNTSIKCVELFSYENKAKELSLVVEDIKVVKEELRSLSMQFSDTNRLKLKVVESSRPKCEREANKVIIWKTGLFSAGEHVKIRNNPALVIGCMLSKDVVIEIKPARMDLSSLIIDTLKMQQFYTSISAVCDQVNKESKRIEDRGELPNPEDVLKLSNTLTMLSRLAQKSNSKVVSFHMIKPIHSRTEATVVELISYGTKEGKNLVLEEKGIEPGTTSLKYWRVLHCMGGIGNLPVTDKEKTNILLGFMHWVPRMTALDESCPMYKNEVTVLEDFKDRSIVNSLASELPSIKNEADRKQIEDLVDYIRDPLILVAKKPFFGRTAQFEPRSRGDSYRDGNFSFSSSSGEAVGCFINSVLHIYLSSDSDALLTEVEYYVLVWQNRIRTDVVTREQHDAFLEMLPMYGHLPKRLTEGAIRGVQVNIENPRMLKLGMPRTSSKVVRVKRNILTVRKSEEKENVSEPRLVWGKASLSIVYDELVSEASYHESILNLRRKLGEAISKDKRYKLPTSIYSDMKLILGKVRFLSDAATTSLALLHIYLVHSAQAARLELSTKSNMLEMLLFKQSSEELRTVSAVRLGVPQPSSCLLDQAESLLEIASRLESVLNQDKTSQSALTEVQHFLDETGNGAVEVGLKSHGITEGVVWHCTVDSTGLRRISGSTLRSLVSNLGSEVLPLQFAPVITDGDLWSRLQHAGKQAKIDLVASRLPDRVIDCYFLAFLFCSCKQAQTRTHTVYPAELLLSAASTNTFKIDDETTALIAGDGEGGIWLHLGLQFSSSETGVTAKLASRALRWHNTLFQPVRSAKDVRNEASAQMVKQEGQDTLRLSYGPRKALETDSFTIFKGISGMDFQAYQSLRQLGNLASLLMGKLCEQSDMEDTLLPSAEYSSAITLDDIFESSGEGSAEAPREEYTGDYEFNF
uniref:RNA-directed RNA polymerase L n=1 Tax=Linzhi Nairo tick virus 1 TaxID=2972223 RepID=A0A9E7V1W5_9VIRU|nr:MAG: RNA-dependent RNA-polymerase [Linzhi Nairo tick virus 1]